MIVLLPQPLGPTSAVFELGFTLKEIFFSTFNSFLEGYEKVTFLNSI